MIILALDIATTTGFAVFDTDRPPSSMLSGSIKFIGSTAFEKIHDMRRKLPKLIRQHQPEFVAIEAPLAFVPQFRKKTKTMFGEEEETSTINPGTIMQLNRLSGAAQMVIQGQNLPCVEVRPQTWQRIIPANIKGPTKKRAAAYCDMLKIVSPNMDSRDACIIALWAAGHCAERKMLERARA